MKRENLTKEQQDYFMLGFQYGQRKSISSVKLAAIAGMILMFLFGMMLPIRCHAQDSDTIKIYEGGTFEPGKHRAIFYKSENDTIPVTILVRISGRPWAFFHDGWEVRRWRMNDFRYLGGEHIAYLDSRKRPIRKEWVIYQTFKR